MKRFKNYFIYLVVLIIIAGVVGWVSLKDKNLSQEASVSNYEECVAAGYPVQEIYPERCVTPDGKSFVNSFSITPNEEVRIKGEIVCLPKKGDGPYTMECAFGLKALDGSYYALSDSDSNYANISDLPTGEVAVITGMFEPVQKDTSYDIVGTILILKVEK